jgi:nitrogen fixation protein FixH
MTMQFNWGTGITAVYSAFALATSGFVYFAMRQPVDLVRPDYYAASLTHDDRLAATRRADALGDAVGVAVHDQARTLAITFPPAHLESMAGTLTLYRAADASADREMRIAPDRQGRQHVPLAGLARGQWLVKLEWRAAGQRFYTERLVVVR